MPFIRNAHLADIDRLVDLEFETFHDIYQENPTEPNAIKDMLLSRFNIIQDLMIVGEIEGSIEGVMACLRTNRDANQIKSWEETTNYGTIIDSHTPEGKNFYIINLAVTERGSEKNLSDQLIANMLGKFIKSQGSQAQLLSRIPQFSQWIKENNVLFDDLSIEKQDNLAQSYTEKTKIVNGKERLYDGVLQRYVTAGAKPIAVLRDGYTDPSSLNYGVLCVYENPLPTCMIKNKAISQLAGKAIQFASNHPRLLKVLP